MRPLACGGASGIFGILAFPTASAMRPRSGSGRLQPAPLLIERSDWQEISDGGSSSGRRCSRPCWPIFTVPARLVSDGVLPAAVVAGSHRSSCGRWWASNPPGGRWLHLMPPTSAAAWTGAGGFSVIGPRRRRAPGYALENRLAMSRAHSAYTGMNVQRLAPFFPVVSRRAGRQGGPERSIRASAC